MRVFKKQGSRCWMCKRTAEDVKAESKFEDYGVSEENVQRESYMNTTYYGNVCVFCEGIMKKIMEQRLSNLRVVFE